jgi:hypothetical protein
MRRLLATRTNFAASMTHALAGATSISLAAFFALATFFAPAHALPSGILHASICDAEEVGARPLNELLGADVSCLMSPRPADELAEARAYLVETATPGYTMTRQGPELAIERLHPLFAIRLADALREARNSGMRDAGIFSAYRPPAFGIGGFSDKFNSLHSYGLAVDLAGIGGPGSAEAQRWHEIAAKHGVACPYGPHNSAEWNHCQPTSLKIILADNPLRETITAAGPVSLEVMFEAGNSLVESPGDISVGKESPVRATLLASANVKAQRPSRNREDDGDEDDDKPKHKRNGRVADIAGAAGKDLPVRATAQASASVKAKRPSRDRDEDDDNDDDKPKHRRNGRVAERRAADKDL